MQVTSSTVKYLTSSDLGQTARPAHEGEDKLRSKSSSQSQTLNTISPAVRVSLSAAAVLHLSQAPASPGPDARISYFAQFFLSRDGFDTSALGATVADPSALSSSAGLSLEDTAADARSRMDAKYAAMKESGQPFSWQSAEGRDRNALFGDLDRRSLLAIRENVSDLFTKEEQAAASKLMNQQQGLAMGLYTGQISQESKFHDPYGDDKVARFTAAGEWLDKVSIEEKRTGEWMQQRVAVTGSLGLARQHTEVAEREWYSLLDLLNLSDEKRKQFERLQGDVEPPASIKSSSAAHHHAQRAYSAIIDDAAS